MGFDVGALHAEGGDDIVDPAIILFKEFRESIPPVAQELFALFRTADYLSGQHRQPRHQVIAPAHLEFLREGWSPGFGSGFITVDQQMRYAF